MIMSRYSDMNYYMEMDIIQGVRMTKFAFEQKAKEDLYLMYLQIYPNMDDTNFISFNDFYEKSVNRVTKRHNKEEVMSNVEKIINSFNSSKGGGDY